MQDGTGEVGVAPASGEPGESPLAFSNSADDRESVESRRAGEGAEPETQGESRAVTEMPAAGSEKLVQSEQPRASQEGRHSAGHGQEPPFQGEEPLVDRNEDPATVEASADDEPATGPAEEPPVTGDDEQPATAGRQWSATGEPRVDEALARLDDLRDLPVTEHRAVFEHVHRQLREVLGELDPGPMDSP
jgi:hypothetical protein